MGSIRPAARRIRSGLCLILATLSTAYLPVTSANAQQPAGQAANATRLAFADIADLVSASPIIAKAQVKSVRTVKFPTSQPGTEGPSYLLVDAEITSLIRGEGGIPPRVSFLTHLDHKEREIRRKNEIIIFANPAETPGQLKLVSRNASQTASAELEQTVRELTRQILADDAPPAVKEVADAFHVAGTVAGESETQIFLKTRTGAPVSLSIIRRPGQPPRWGVSLGEIVDETAVPPEHGTLLWYRLACGLPPTLPATATRSLEAADMTAAQRDYNLVIESLGSCGRTL